MTHHGIHWYSLLIPDDSFCNISYKPFLILSSLPLLIVIKSPFSISCIGLHGHSYPLMVVDKIHAQCIGAVVYVSLECCREIIDPPEWWYSLQYLCDYYDERSLWGDREIVQTSLCFGTVEDQDISTVHSTYVEPQIWDSQMWHFLFC